MDNTKFSVMEESLKIDYEKKIAEMEALIEVLKQLRSTKITLSKNYLAKAELITDELDNTLETEIVKYEFIEKSLQYGIDVFSLDAEIEMKVMILKNYKERSVKDEENTKQMAEKAKQDVPDRIKRAKQLADHYKMPHDLKLKLRGVANVYQTRYRFGYPNDEEAAAFLTGLNTLIDSAENWIK